MTTRDSHLKPVPPTTARKAPAQAAQKPPRLFECKLCGKVFDAEKPYPTCPECDSSEVEQVG